MYSILLSVRGTIPVFVLSRNVNFPYIFLPWHMNIMLSNNANNQAIQVWDTDKDPILHALSSGSFST